VHDINMVPFCCHIQASTFLHLTLNIKQVGIVQYTPSASATLSTYTSPACLHLCHCSHCLHNLPLFSASNFIASALYRHWGGHACLPFISCIVCLQNIHLYSLHTVPHHLLPVLHTAYVAIFYTLHTCLTHYLHTYTYTSPPSLSYLTLPLPLPLPPLSHLSNTGRTVSAPGYEQG